jgi:cytosine/adenosine deaminase-related metal-dependent hydrolase
MTHDEPAGCLHPTRPGEECSICAEREAARINTLADGYKRGLDRMVASGYEEFGIDVLRNHATVIKALRAYAGPRASAVEMRALVSAIIQDEAKYDPATNTWDVEKAAADIVTAFETA